MIEITPIVRYKILFMVHLSHSFYGDNFPKDLTIVPTKTTKKKLRNWQLLFKRTPTGVQVLYNVVDESRLLRLLQQQEKLTFLVLNRNPLFINFTQLPLVIKNRIYYFHNHHKNEKEGRKLIQQEEKVGMRDILPIYGSVFKIPINGQKQIVIKNNFGTIVSDEAVEGKKKHYINLSEEESGKYEIWADGKLMQVFYMGNDMPERLLGVIEVYLEETGNTNYEVFEEKITTQEYHIDFSARATLWKYFFINRNKSSTYSGFRITNIKKDIAFEAEENVILEDGSPATMLVSKAAITLKEKPKEILQLKVRRNGKGIHFQMNLPHPPLEIIKPDSEDSGNVYSEVYVYL